MKIKNKNMRNIFFCFPAKKNATCVYARASRTGDYGTTPLTSQRQQTRWWRGKKQTCTGPSSIFTTSIISRDENVIQNDQHLNPRIIQIRRVKNELLSGISWLWSVTTTQAIQHTHTRFGLCPFNLSHVIIRRQREIKYKGKIPCYFQLAHLS